MPHAHMEGVGNGYWTGEVLTYKNAGDGFTGIGIADVYPVYR
ncbi:MAG: hypothetical protein WKF97_12195 [Chitinophagaceae bacterium]